MIKNDHPNLLSLQIFFQWSKSVMAFDLKNPRWVAILDFQKLDISLPWNQILGCSFLK